jgi:diaminohydroxyphosphoribosylaminopyrimidine deaminase/5-amino-6-(5-phosphoribosylamino)uracil reductase
MSNALALGRRTMGATGDNPAVGCVIVRNGVVKGVGWTGFGGRPHAEIQALAMAGGDAKGATAFVTLEPCSHHGRTPPCADALAQAGIACVVAALEDPDRRVKGQGFAKLRRHGIRVEIGEGAHEARRDLAGFISRNVTGRPHVTLKLAVSADGMIAPLPRRRTLITGDMANARVHLMRAQSDAVMVGAATVATDDPALTSRLPGLEHRSPVAVVVDGRLSMPLGARLVSEAPRRPLFVMTGLTAQTSLYEERGVKVLRCPELGDSNIDLAAGLTALGEIGINTLLVEGGAALAQNLLSSNLINAMAIFVSPRTIGPAGLRAPIRREDFRLIEQEQLGDDTLSHYERLR